MPVQVVRLLCLGFGLHDGRLPGWRRLMFERDSVAHVTNLDALVDLLRVDDTMRAVVIGI